MEWCNAKYFVKDAYWKMKNRYKNDWSHFPAPSLYYSPLFPYLQEVHVKYDRILSDNHGMFGNFMGMKMRIGEGDWNFRADTVQQPYKFSSVLAIWWEPNLGKQSQIQAETAFVGSYSSAAPEPGYNWRTQDCWGCKRSPFLFCFTAFFSWLLYGAMLQTPSRCSCPGKGWERKLFTRNIPWKIAAQIKAKWKGEAAEEKEKEEGDPLLVWRACTVWQLGGERGSRRIWIIWGSRWVLW